MRKSFLVFLMGCCLGAWAQSSSSPGSSSPTPPNSGNSSSSNSPAGAPSSANKPGAVRKANLDPPRSDRVHADALGDAPGESSSKDSQIDLSPPADDSKVHPQSSDALMKAEVSAHEVNEFHPWDPHKAAKDIEVGDFYFKRGNYHAAEDRYREALLYKENDALATYRLAVSLEKLDRPGEAREAYESYLKILPYGPQAKEAQKAVDRLKVEEDRVKSPAANTKPAK